MARWRQASYWIHTVCTEHQTQNAKECLEHLSFIAHLLNHPNYAHDLRDCSNKLFQNRCSDHVIKTEAGLEKKFALFPHKHFPFFSKSRSHGHVMTFFLLTPPLICFMPPASAVFRLDTLNCNSHHAFCSSQHFSVWFWVCSDSRSQVAP